jgi:hypothetical protein
MRCCTGKSRSLSCGKRLNAVVGGRPRYLVPKCAERRVGSHRRVISNVRPHTNLSAMAMAHRCSPQRRHDCPPLWGYAALYRALLSGACKHGGVPRHSALRHTLARDGQAGRGKRRASDDAIEREECRDETMIRCNLISSACQGGVQWEAYLKQS